MSPDPAACPDENRLLAWAAGSCAEGEARILAEHAERCPDCRRAMAIAMKELRPDGEAEPTATHSPWAPGEVLLGKYRVEQVLAGGGMGIVARALHLKLNEAVALKFIRRELADDPDVMARFSREARATVRLNNEHVCHVFDLEVLPDGTPFIVMEHLEGDTLDARLRRSGVLAWPEAVRWVLEALDGVEAAHRAGIVHRDLKPENLFIQRTAVGERLKILDFGVAKSFDPEIEAGLAATTAGVAVGSPSYMAPEQVTDGAHVDLRADLWGLGCTLYALVAGSPPFRGGSLRELTDRIRAAQPPELRVAVPSALKAVIAKCLEKAPERRFGSAGEVAQALRQVLAARRRRGLATIAIAAAAVIVCAAGAELALESHPPPVVSPLIAPAVAAPAPPIEVKVPAPEAPKPAAVPAAPDEPPRRAPSKRRPGPARSTRSEPAPVEPAPVPSAAELYDQRL
jgi:serine/threonine-protein kinase